MAKHFFSTGVTLIAYGYKTSRDLRWYALRRLDRRESDGRFASVMTTRVG